MKVVRHISELDLPWGGPIGFVPTMGAFHEGHLSLMREAKRICTFCVVSLFVNPTQFNDPEDLSKYPRNENADFDMASEVGVDAIFAPDVEEMYGMGDTRVTASRVAERWEGEHRPGHFDGVTTVVAKLFNIVRPSDAFFGLKDLQQCAVIGSMVHDLKFPLRLHYLETVREADGLAMSSRNAKLSPQDRVIAPGIYRVLAETASHLTGGVAIDRALDSGRNLLGSMGFAVEYLGLVDPSSMEPLTVVQAHSRLVVAARLGNTRLIDNIAVF